MFPGWDFPFCHGPIDRKESEKRLREYDQVGAYLLRTKDSKGSEFVYSYLAFNKAVNHAKVLIKGKTFTIDGRTYEGGPSGVDLFDVVAQCAKLHEEAGLSQGSGVARPLTSAAPSRESSSSKKSSKSSLKADIPVIKSGHLCKRALGRSIFGRDVWKERWFVLTEAELTYYTKPIKGTRKGKVMTDSIVAVDSASDNVGRPFVFCVFFKVYTLHVQAQSLAERQAWIEALRTLIGEGQPPAAAVPQGQPVARSVSQHGRPALPTPDKSRTEVPAAAKPKSTGASERAKTTPSRSKIPEHFKAPWYFPEFTRVHCDKVMAKAAPGDFIARNSSQGDKIVMVVKDEYFNNRYFHLTPLPNGELEVTPELHVLTLEEAVEGMKANPPLGKNDRPIFLKKMATIAPGDSVDGADAEVGESHHDPSLWKNRDITDDGEDLTIFIAPPDDHAFETLDTNDTLPEELPAFARGRKLNRYWDILPNPVTRVRLDVQNNEPSTEYINANYIRGYGDRSVREYIAAQGPEKNMIESMVRMIWEKDVDIVVCLTKLQQGHRKKCERYWPDCEDEPFVCGKFTQVLTSVEYGNGLVKYQIELTDGHSIRTVYFFWFNSWPDHDVPTDDHGNIDARSILSLVGEVRACRRRLRRANPILVHCSAGIGRTGAFIAIDHAVNAMQSRNQVDVTEIIKTLREDRMGMVQSTSQYKFIYQACLTYASTRFAKAVVLTGVPTTSVSVGDALRKDTLNKNGTWKMHKLEDGLATFELRANAAPMRLSPNDKVIIPEDAEDDGAPRVPKSKSPETRRKKLKEHPLEAQPWFRGSASRVQVEELLRDAPHGMFIVRPSSKEGLFAVSVQHGNLTYGDDPAITNMLCIPVAQGNGKVKYKLGDYGDVLFDDVVLLVMYFMENPYAVNERTGEMMYLKYFDSGSAHMDKINSVKLLTKKGDFGKQLKEWNESGLHDEDFMGPVPHEQRVASFV